MAAPAHAEPNDGSSHILTIALEDYFQVGAFNKFVQKNQWYRFETRLGQTTQKTLELLAAHETYATFFVLGWIAKRFPKQVRAIADAGHEVAIKGYYHRSIRGMTPEEFQADTLRAKEVVEQASGRPVVGYRLADGWFEPRDLWALDVLAEHGFLYDSSLAPMGSHFTDQPFRSFTHLHESHGRAMWEVPISTAKILGLRVPIAGGNYLRQIPWWLTQRARRRWVEQTGQPIVAYFHTWELDADQPRLAVGGWLTQKRHYRNLQTMPKRLESLISEFRFTSVAQALGLDAFSKLPGSEEVPEPNVVATVFPGYKISADTPSPRIRAEQQPVTIVVPLFNEAESIGFLAKALDHVRTQLSDRYQVRYILVDDGSTDDTWQLAEAAFQDKPYVELQQHPVNLGVSAAIMTGIRRAGTEIVASMDCDCSYEPLELRSMIPLLQPGVSLVTASPYHRDGRVRNVPSWRLFLSRGATWMYRRILTQKLYTYTSCFRVYRRSAVAGLKLKHNRYLGIAELVGRLDLTGDVIVEYPTTLEVRVLGRSKMKTVRTILGHLGLMASLLRARLFSKWRPAQRDQVIKEVIGSHREHKALLIRNHPPGSETSPDDVRRLVVNPVYRTTEPNSSTVPE